jgi:hypothetical protein
VSRNGPRNTYTCSLFLGITIALQILRGCWKACLNEITQLCRTTKIFVRMTQFMDISCHRPLKGVDHLGYFGTAWDRFFTPILIDLAHRVLSGRSESLQSLTGQGRPASLSSGSFSTGLGPYSETGGNLEHAT